MHFASDNWAGAHPAIAAALAEAATGFAPAYGNDPATKAAEAAFAALFERDVAVFFVVTGTAANALAIASLAKPGGLVLCHASAHINADEGGAPEFQSSNKLVQIGGDAAKLTPSAVAAALRRYPPNPGTHGRPVAVSISQLTEMGARYTPAEVATLAEVAHAAGLGVHMDGSRFGNAVAASNATPAELTWKAGVDVLSFGGTKGGCIGAEAVVIFDKARAGDFPYLRKRAGHLVSKSRFVAAQFNAYLGDGLWLQLARHANRLARRLADGIVAAGHRLAAAAEGNEVFAILPLPAIARLRAAGAVFYDWAEDFTAGPDEALVRLVASFASTDAEVDRFLAILTEA